MTRCYEFYCWDDKCKEMSRTVASGIEEYCEAARGYDVEFNKTKKDKKIFTDFVDLYGTERAFLRARSRHDDNDPSTPLQLRLFNTWSFDEALHGNPKYKWGYNTGHITENLLYYYTQENDLVIDPMVGSGTTIGACERMNRRCLSFDKEEDIRTGIETEELAQLVFLDPPFYTLLENEFEDYRDFKTFVLVCIEKSIKVLKSGGYLAVIMKNLSEAQDNPKHCMIGDVYKILASQETLKFENMILAPLSTQRSGTDKAKENKELLNNARVVWVFRKL